MLIGVELFLKLAHLEDVHHLKVDLLKIHVLNSYISLVRKKDLSTADLCLSNFNFRLNVLSNIVEGRSVLDIVLQHIVQHMQKIR